MAHIIKSEEDKHKDFSETHTHTEIGVNLCPWWNWTTEWESTTVFFITSSDSPHTPLCKSAGHYSWIHSM